MFDVHELASALQGISGFHAYALVFSVLFACGIGVPIPEDITLFIGGLLSYYGKANVYLMIVVSLAGVLIGDTIMYVAGRKYGRALIARSFFAKLLHAERMEQVQRYFHKHGNKVIFAARFMPGARSLVFFSAGMLHLPFRVFLGYDGSAALISVPAIVYSVYYFGSEVDLIISRIKQVEHSIIFVVLGVVAFVIVRALFRRWRARRAATADSSAS